MRYRLVRLPTADANRFSNGKGTAGMSRLNGTIVASGSADQSSAYPILLHDLPNPTSPGLYPARDLTYLYDTGPTRYAVSGTTGHRVLRARTVVNKRTVWANPGGGAILGSLIPAGGDDTAFRALAGYQWSTQTLFPPAFVRQGTFDANKLPGYSALAQVPLGTYASTVLTGATTKDRKALGGKALPASPNIPGYVQPAPLMLTPLSSLPVFEEADGYTTKLPGDASSAPATPINAKAPISSVRVRVRGVAGVDALSRARVRLVAQQIQAKTGLLVDVTIGSSPAPQTVVLAAGAHGRPQLALQENWVKKGVALAILTAVDKKSLALFLLVLLVCGLFVTNAAGASVRARRTELGVLACLGWPKTRLFALVGVELGVIAVAAGIGGGLLAWAIGSVFAIPVSPSRAVLAVPAALVVALVAGVVPAWRAAHAPPLEAVRPTAALAKRAAQPGSVAGLAWINVSRTRARSALAAAGLAVAVAALTVVVGIVAAFRGAVVGTLLGSAVTVQVRGSDYTAVAAIIILAGTGVANVLFLSIRERGPELATLRALGWTEATLARLLLLEGLYLGLAGSLSGAGAGIVVLALLLGTPGPVILLTALTAFAAGLIVATLATLPPVASIRALPTALLLTEE